jgi:RoxA-like, cytochrome c-like
MERCSVGTLIAACLFFANGTSAANPIVAAAQRGYRHLRETPYLPPDFDADVFHELWKRWPEPLRSKAAKATPRQRRKMAFERYGLMEPPEPKPGEPALGYVDDGKRGWVMNCFACHAGKVAGKVIPGAPNTHLDLQSLTEDVRATKIRLGKKLTHMDLGSLRIPLNTTAGTTNSVVFGIVLGELRDKDMNVVLRFKRERPTHHDMDAPPWWNVRKKTMLYCDAFSPKNHRVLMQFILIPQNGRKKILAWEKDFADILAYIESVRPPKYPWPIDRKLAAKGKTVFEQNCARCHGTYAWRAGSVSDRRKATAHGLTRSVSEGDANPSLTRRASISRNAHADRYPQKVVPIDEIGTDPVRWKALTVTHRKRIEISWMSRYGKDRTVIHPVGYVAPPLDGVWASAPYFHNGSVPTLWHVLHPEKRPRIWKRTSLDGYDRKRIGLPVETFTAMPKGIADKVERRRYFNTTKFGKSAAGHHYPNSLSEEERRAVLEYLKTL